MTAHDDDGADADVAEMRAGARRLGRRRAAQSLAAGLACAVVGAPTLWWGRHMDAIQDHSEIQFELPTYAQFAGGALLVAAAVFVAIGVVAFVMSAVSR